MLHFKLRSAVTSVFVVIVLPLICSCNNNDTPAPAKPVVPTLTTKEAIQITTSSAQLGGIIVTNGDAPITGRGIVWSPSPDPTIDLATKTTDGFGNGGFTSQATLLSSGTKYFARAYATNSAGTGYGDEINFTTLPDIVIPPFTNGVTTPPTSLGLNSFYKKYLNASGIPVISSLKVSDLALVNVSKTVSKMVSFRSDVLNKMIQNKIRIGIVGKTEVTTDMPEHSDLNKVYPGTNWNGYRGLGATVDRPLGSCAEENVLCEANDPYVNEDILVHEFAHGIHGLGIRYVDPDIDKELQQALLDATSKGLWKNAYAGSNYIEYFAEGVQSWFNVNAESIPENGIHNHVNTREELKLYDPGSLQYHQTILY